jgi:hypothetical protein
MLLEEEAPQTERNVKLNRAKLNRDSPYLLEGCTTGEPSAAELLQAIAGWIEADIKPAAQGRDRFMASVALNALGIVQREAAHPVEVHNKALSEDLLAGRQSLSTPGLLARLKSQALAKLAADQPKYSALAAAVKKWSI